MKHEPWLFIGSHSATIQGERVDLYGRERRRAVRRSRERREWSYAGRPGL